MKIRPVVAEVICADGQTHRQSDGQIYRQTDMKSLVVVFPNYAKVH
jgi:hypothetical protein